MGKKKMTKKQMLAAKEAGTLQKSKRRKVKSGTAGPSWTVEDQHKVDLEETKFEIQIEQEDLQGFTQDFYVDRKERKVEEEGEEEEMEEDEEGNKEDEEDEGEDAQGNKGLSKKALRRLRRLSPAQLKQLVNQPENVEQHDANATDPKLLIFLKSYRNTVPVPRHWSQKRKYLQNKRGIDKPPFQLPAFLADTGITKIREAFQAREEQKRARQKAQDKMRPKMNKIDIDYQVLHDAFFKHQTKPRLSKHGDLYFEGKEFEVRLPEHRHGQLSERLRQALGMPDGAPPPWLINMQRYGPPPSYPHAKIAGLNAPLPPGAQYGYHPGGWGKPPVDEQGNPLYGDVFGTQAAEENVEDGMRGLWGEMAEPESEESDDDDDEGPVPGEGDETEPPSASGVTSTVPLSEATFDTGTVSISATETPGSIPLRKYPQAQGGQPGQLYQVLPQQATGVGASLMGSQHVYAMPSASDDVDA